MCGSALNGMALIRLSAENYLSVEADLQYNTYNWHHKLAQLVQLWKTSSIVFNIIPGTGFDINSVQEHSAFVMDCSCQWPTCIVLVFMRNAFVSHRSLKS